MARQLLRNSTGDLAAAILYDELSHDVIALPSPWHCCAALPWQCSGRRRRSAATRRLIYWIHALPPLGPERSQQYVCCEGYAVAAVRRDDGIHCWAIMDVDSDQARIVPKATGQSSSSASGATEFEGSSGKVLA